MAKLTERIKEARKKPGGSNVGKYKGVKKFAGPAGGAPKGSFPINTLPRARNALARAHLAPDPKKLKAAVYKAFPELAKRNPGSAKKAGVTPKANRKRGMISGMKKR